MNRLILGSALAGTLAAGVFIFWPAPRPADAGSETSAGTASGVVSSSATGEAKAFKESRVKSSAVSGVASRFVKRSEEIAAMPRTTEREDAIRSLAHEWAAEDFAGAERWAAAFEDPADLNRALTHVCLERAGSDPRDAIEMAQWHKLGYGTVEVIAGRWAEADFGAAAAWVKELPEGEMRDGLLARLALSRAETAPAEAASMVATSLAAGKVQEEAAISVLHQWLLRDPKTAEQWVAAFPEGPLKRRASHEIQGMTAYRNERPAAP